LFDLTMGFLERVGVIDNDVISNERLERVLDEVVHPKVGVADRVCSPLDSPLHDIGVAGDVDEHRVGADRIRYGDRALAKPPS